MDTCSFNMQQEPQHTTHLMGSSLGSAEKHQILCPTTLPPAIVPKHHHRYTQLRLSHLTCITRTYALVQKSQQLKLLAAHPMHVECPRQPQLCQHCQLPGPQTPLSSTT